MIASGVHAGKDARVPRMEPQPEKYSFDFKKEAAEIVADSHDALGIKLGEFAVPLDLLLYLIRQEQADIFDILRLRRMPISQDLLSTAMGQHRDQTEKIFLLEPINS